MSDGDTGAEDRDPVIADALTELSGIAVARTAADRAAAVAVRWAVFVEEQDVPARLELDEHDDAASTVHLIARADEAVIGTARLRPYEPADDGTASTTARPTIPAGDGPVPTAKLERVAVRAAHRNAGHGDRLVEAAERIARARGVERIVLDAQLDVIEFYERHGYRVVGEPFPDAGILHRRMWRRL